MRREGGEGGEGVRREGGDSDMLPIEDTSRVGTQLQVTTPLKYVPPQCHTVLQ